MDVHQPLTVEGPVVLPRRCREGEQRVAVIGGGERDDRVLPGEPSLHPVLPRQLQRRFDGFRPGREEVELVEVPGERGRELRRQGLDRLVREGRP